MSYQEAAGRCAGYIRLKGHTKSTPASKINAVRAIRSYLAQLLHEELLRTPTPSGSAAGNSRRGLDDGERRGFVFSCVSMEIERQELASSR